MQRRWLSIPVVFRGWLALAAAASADEPLARLKHFSDFQQVDLGRLWAGDVLAERGSLMNFPNGITVQTCFIVPLAPQATAKRLQAWDPSPHGALKVYAYHPLRAPCDPADFTTINFKSDKHAVRWLLDKTLATTAERSDLNLSRAEAQALAGAATRGSDVREVNARWTRLLVARAVEFQRRGFSGVAPYELGGEIVAPSAQLRFMLKSQPQVAREFEPVLQKSGLLGGGGGGELAAPFYYWDLFDADGKATLSLGAIFVLPVADHYQVLDAEYYVSSNYYTSATLYEIWPLSAGGKAGSLVWRGDFFAAPTLSYTKGVERIAYGALMLLDIKKSIRFFQDDVKAGR